MEKGENDENVRGGEPVSENIEGMVNEMAPSMKTQDETLLLGENEFAQMNLHPPP